MSTSGERVVRLEGCLNFRDLGGYPAAQGKAVRWGQVFRSDALHLLSPSDVAHLRDQLRIGDIVDLRSTAELRTDGRGPLAREAIRFHHVPLFDNETRTAADRREDLNLADRYFLLAQFAMERIGRVIATLAETDSPAVYHCAAGKDRTGVISALILGLLGVTDEVIIADYALTQENLDDIVQRLLSTEGYRTMLNALPPDTLHAQPQTMASFLDKIREQHGSARGYAEAAGLSTDTIEKLVRRLLV